MSHWIALWPAPSSTEQHRQQLAWWGLQFTPRVAWLASCLVLEVQASARLFGGLARLHTLIGHGAANQAVTGWAWARTALAACAGARQGVAPESPEGAPRAPRAQVARLPLDSLPGLAAHAHALSRLGCRTLADVLKLPRDGLTRRLGPELLHTLDTLTGRRPQALEWLTLPSAFEARCELPHALDNAPALMAYWAPLLDELAGWLMARHLGACSVSLHWQHAWRNHEGERTGQHLVRLSNPSQDAQRLQQLVAEHLGRLVLGAPVNEVSLRTSDLMPWQLSSAELFQEWSVSGGQTGAALSPAMAQARRDRWLAWMDRVSTRLGAEQVTRGGLRADHRIEHTQVWPVAVAQGAVTPVRTAQAPMEALPQPTWLLPQPLPLALVRDGVGGLRELPGYQGALTLLAGPHRVEAGWWDDAPGALVVRDYYLASSPQAGLLWVFKVRPAMGAHGSPWFLHGFFA